MLQAQLLTAMVTPFDRELHVDYDKAADLARYLVRQGSQGLVVCGTTGESPTLSKEEKLELFRCVRAAVPGVPLWAGTGSYDTAASVALTKAAAATGVDGILAVAPYYNKPTQEGLYQHYKAIAGASDLPVMVYNIPGRSVINILPATMARLAEIQNIRALKEATGNMNQMAELRRALPEEFVIYSGDDSMTLPMLALGAQGVVSVAAHLIGPAMREMLAAWEAGERAKALELHLQLYPVFTGLFFTTSPVPVKTALSMLGMEMGGFRLPLVELDPAEREVLAKLLKDHGIMA
ncbi:MAG: 4-hydroxy-tetrahydrodipicolinate synthase [Syntrophomonadaceae bacterium]|nr:4-hydroxy-tetrahydrodipicolinate synthase [Syntrophomonadaceae bacterium]